MTRTPIAGRARGATLSMALASLLVLGLAFASCAESPLSTETHPKGGGGRAPAHTSAGSQPKNSSARGIGQPSAQVCGSRSLEGPATKPSGAKTVDSRQNLYDVVNQHPPRTTFWLKPGIHHVNRDEFGQVIPKRGDTFIGAPGAILDGRHINRYAFTGSARNVTIRYLTIRHFGTKRSNNGEGVVNHDSAEGWHVLHSTIKRNGGAGVFLGNR